MINVIIIIIRKATKASVEFEETLPSPNALSSAAEISKSTRLEHAFIKTFKRALLGDKSSLERKRKKKGLFKC